MIWEDVFNTGAIPMLGRGAPSFGIVLSLGTGLASGLLLLADSFHWQFQTAGTVSHQCSHQNTAGAKILHLKRSIKKKEYVNSRNDRQDRRVILL